MQVLKFQAQLSQLKRTAFLAGTEFIDGEEYRINLNSATPGPYDNGGSGGIVKLRNSSDTNQENIQLDVMVNQMPQM